MSKKAPSLGSLINAYLFYSYSIDISPTKTLIFMNIFIRGRMYVFPQVILQTRFPLQKNQPATAYAFKMAGQDAMIYYRFP